MADNLGFIPARVVAGESIWLSASNSRGTAVDIIIPDYLPADFTLAYSFASSTALTVTAVANNAGTGWTLEVTGAQTLLWTPGAITYVGVATSKTVSGRTFCVDRGDVRVDGSPLQASSYTALLAAIDAAIAEYAANPIGSFSLGDMSISYRSMADLMNLRNFYKAQLDRQTAGRTKRIIRTRFT
jgi:hypothetical protein